MRMICCNSNGVLIGVSSMNACKQNLGIEAREEKAQGNKDAMCSQHRTRGKMPVQNNLLLHPNKAAEADSRFASLRAGYA